MADDGRVCSKKGCHQELPPAENYAFRLCESCRTKARLAKQKQLQREREKATERRTNSSVTPVSSSIPSLNQTPATSALPNSTISSISTVLTASMENQNLDHLSPGQGLVTWSTCRFKPLDGDYVLSYTLFRGLGPPPVFLGLLGDIYLDVTQGHYQLYGRTIQGWVVWSGPKETQHLIAHPGLKNRFLWCSVSHSALGWLTSAQVASDTRTASECLSQVLDTAPTSKRKAESNNSDIYSVKRLKLEASTLSDIKFSFEDSSISMNGIRPIREANNRKRRKPRTSTLVNSARFKVPRSAPLPSRRRTTVLKHAPQEKHDSSSSVSISAGPQSRKRRLQELEHELSNANNTIGVLQQMMYRVCAQDRATPNNKLTSTAPPTPLPTVAVPSSQPPLPTPPTPTAPTAPPKSSASVGGGTSTVLECYNCQASTPFWTKDEKGRVACKECYSHYKTHGGDRPIEQEPQKSAPPVCAKCSTTESSVWRDDNRGRLLCNTCGLASKWRGPVRVTGYEVQAAAPVAKKEEVDVVLSVSAPPPAQRPLTITIPSLAARAKIIKTSQRKPAPPAQSASAPVLTTLADKRCYNCDAPSSRSWTKIDGKPACNRCWQYRRRKGIDRPNNISTNALRTKSCRETAAKNAKARRAAASEVGGEPEPRVKAEPVDVPQLEVEDKEEAVRVKKEEERAAPALKPKVAKSAPTNRCYNCGTTHSACGRWPKIADGRRACNRCFLYWRAHGFDRPNVTTQTALRIKTKEMEAHTQGEPAPETAGATVVDQNTPAENQCYNCETRYSMSGWWPKIDDGRTACNRCWLYHRRKGVHRPKGITADELRKQSLRETWAKQKKIKAEALEAELSDAQSGSATPV